MPILQSVRKQQADIIRAEGSSLHSLGSQFCQGGSHFKRKRRPNGDKLDHLLQGKLILSFSFILNKTDVCLFQICVLLSINHNLTCLFFCDRLHISYYYLCFHEMALTLGAVP